ncbi:MAG: nucleotidyl transferase AbiEii/AbiGii toxin family protein, partial [Pirellulaceae bacterium]
MDKVAALPMKQRNELFQASADRRGLLPAIIEKDFWVCWLLKKLFASDELEGQLVFKGGTSLSKVHHLIERFSEDIDLVLNWGLLGYGDEGIDPWQNLPSTNSQNRFNEEFNRRSATYIRETLHPLVETITQSVDEIRCVIPENDPNVIEVQYPASFSSTAFKPEVKLEIGPLASWIPKADHVIQPYAGEDFPRVFDNADCPVVAITAERTFWEKATILHQQAHRHGHLPPRYSRHYYDLYRMTQSEVASNALAEISLLADV